MNFEHALRDDFLKKNFNGAVCIHHIDITCDGCEKEPIIGKRYKCQKCEDIDLCETCMRALIAARVEMSQQAGTLPEPPLQSQRPRHWISKLRSEDGKVKWSALQQAVPCLHSSHTFCQVTQGPERALVLSLDSLAEAQKEDTMVVDEQVVQKFLDFFPPSKCECSDLAWLVCNITTAAEESTSETPSRDLDSRVEAAIDDWERILNKRKPTSEDVDALARRHRIKRGKWIAFPKAAAEADDAWQAAVSAAASGGLGCTQIKISSNNPREEGHVLMAYTEDYLDKKAVDAAAAALGAALPHLKDARLLYKADITTYLGIYAKNEYNLKPTIYTAQLR